MRRYLLASLLTGAGFFALGQTPPLALMPPRVTSPVPEAPPAEPDAKTLPINLATALQLAGANPIDVQLATRQLELSTKSYDRAKLLWLPNIMVGGDYFHHDGLQQNFAGELVKSSRSSAMVGFGPNVVFGVTDAIYSPLAARQDVRARQAQVQAVTNDVTLQVAEAYFQLQQARGELAGAILATAKAEEVSRRAEKLAEGLAPPLEATRAKVELARRKQAEATARERRAVMSAELTRILRLNTDAVLEPSEPAFLPVTVIDANTSLDVLIPIALTTRPELAGQQSVVQAALTRLKQEKIRPLIPSVALRSVSTNPSGSLGYGTFGGGSGGKLDNFSSRYDVDLQVMWEFQQLGFGNRIRAGERKIEYEMAILEMFRTQDRVAAEVATAHAQVKAATERLKLAEPAFRDAVDLMQKSLDGMSQTRRTGDVLTLVVRPQEVVAAVQLLSQTNIDFHTAVADYNRAQFRLYRALGHPVAALPSAVTP
jgi:outer membrane protein TolC